MAWSDEAKRAACDAFAKLGSAATYTPAGGQPFPTTVVLERGVRAYPSPEETLVTGPMTIARVLVEEVPAQEHGDEIQIGAELFTVQEVLANDGYVAELRVW